MAHILIAGATSYLGRYTVQACKQAGYRVRALVRTPQKLSHPGAAFAPAVDQLIDEVVVGDVTHPHTLSGICKSIDVVFSSVSLMGQKSNLSWYDVDYVGNANLLREAKAAGVGKFIFISVFKGQQMTHVPMVKAHEDLAIDLAASGLDYTVIRPSGFFSDLSQMFEMARQGRFYVLGNGRQKLNPIHGADLAQVCLAAATKQDTDIDVGGPDSLSWNDIGRLAFGALDKPVRITRVPLGLAKAVTNGVRLFSPRTAQLWDFFLTGAELDLVAPPSGTHHLADHYRALASEHQQSADEKIL